MISKKLLVPALLLLPAGALAADINIRGFASIVAGQTLSSDEQLYNYENSVDFRQDSLFAVQFDANLQDKLSATMQIMSRGRDDFDATVEWAYLTYKFTDELQLSAGRIRAPFYRYSDLLDVRYTYPWVKVPQTVYGFELPGYYGVSLVHSMLLGSWDSSVQLVYGSLDGAMPGYEGLDIVAKNLAGLNWTLNRDWLTLRAGYFKSKVTLDNPQDDGLVQLVDGFGAATQTDLSAVVDGIEMDNDPGTFFGLAMGIDYNNIVLDAEYINYTLDNSLAPDTGAYYVTAGYRFGRVMPYVTYSESDQKVDLGVVDLIPATIASFPIEQLGGATLPQALTGAFTAAEVDVKLHSVGVRYDFHKSAALKAEYTNHDDGGNGGVKLLRVGVDLVF